MKKILSFLVLVVVILGLGWYFSSDDSQKEVEQCLATKSDEDCYRQFLQAGIDFSGTENPDYQSALEQFKLSAQSYANDKTKGYTVWRNMANAHMELKQYDEAKEIFNDLLQINHGDMSLVYLDYIRLYDMQKDYETALQVAQEGFDKFSEVVFLYKQANILEDLERYAEEVEIYEQILEMTDLERRSSVEYKIEKLKAVHNLD